MVEMKAWYEPGQHDPMLLTSEADVDALLDRMVEDAAKADIGVIAEIDRRDEDGWAILQFGVKPDRGFVGHVSPAGSVISSNSRPAEPLIDDYDYMAHERSVVGNAEIALPLVRQAVREFVATGGGRPGGIPWQDVQDS